MSRTATRNGSNGAKAEGGGIEAVLSAIDNASQEELDSLKAQIADEEQQLEVLVAGRRKKIDALNKLAGMIDVRLNGKPARKTASRNGPALSPLRKKVKLWMLEQDGPQKPSAIAAGVGSRVSSIYAALSHPAFRKVADGFVVAENDAPTEMDGDAGELQEQEA